MARQVVPLRWVISWLKGGKNQVFFCWSQTRKNPTTRGSNSLLEFPLLLLKVVKLEPSTLVNTNGNQVSVKAVVVGDAAVGKTCLLQAVLQLEANQNNNNANQNHYITTMRADGKDITFNLYDTSGQDESDRSRMNVYDGTDIFLLCFSIISPYSFENIRTKVGRKPSILKTPSY
jgi:hypothetical protein